MFVLLRKFRSSGCHLTIRTGVASAIIGLLCTTIGGASYGAEVTDSKFYAASGTFYYWFPGLEMTAGRGPIWSGPDPLMCFKHEIWYKCDEDFEDLVLEKLRNSYNMKTDREAMARDAIQSIAFSSTGISMTWKNLTALSPDPSLAADVANASLDVFSDVGFKKRGTNSWFKTMVRADIPTNTATWKVIRQLDDLRDRWYVRP